MIIPIHAYPKMNIHVKEYFPKYIDFGTVQLNLGDNIKEYNNNTI
jgi:hypothetical protein